MNDNITLEEETAPLSEGHLEAQHGHPRTARGKDLKFSPLQTYLTKAGHIAVKSTDLPLNLKAKVDSTFARKLNKLMVMTMDAIALLAMPVLNFHSFAVRTSSRTFKRIMATFVMQRCLWQGTYLATNCRPS